MFDHENFGEIFKTICSAVILPEKMVSFYSK